MDIYALPGLGLNAHIYDRLKLIYPYTVLEWIEPVKEESLSNYALRFSTQIIINDKPIVLIGHSFGGVLAQEIAQHLKVDKIILISSIQSRSELPPSFKLLDYINAYKLMSQKNILSTFPLWARSNGYKSKEARQVFKDSVRSLSNYYMQWSLKELTQWKGCALNCKVYQFHGSKDKTFPIRYIPSPDLRIEKGDHIMVYNKGEQLSVDINRLLGTI